MEAQQQSTAHGRRSGAARRKLKKEKQAMLNAQFAGLEIDSEKQQKLPAELVYHIIELGAETPDGITADSDQAQAVRFFLCTTSLVCSDWREHSQRVLMDFVSLKTDQELNSFLLSPQLETLRHARIVAQEGSVLDGELVEAIIASSRLLSLQLGGINSLSAFSLYSASLQGLKDLVLTRPIGFKLGTTKRALLYRSLQLPFSLDTLVVEAWGEAKLSLRPLALIGRLLSNPTGSVKILLSGDQDYFKVPFVFPNSANQLRELQLCYTCECTHDAVDSLLPFIRQCHQLEVFSTNFVNSKLIKTIPSILRQLSLHGVDEQWVQAVPNLLKENCRTLSRLSQIKLLCIAELPPYALLPLRIECKKRGIELLLERIARTDGARYMSSDTHH